MKKLLLPLSVLTALIAGCATSENMGSGAPSAVLAEPAAPEMVEMSYITQSRENLMIEPLSKRQMSAGSNLMMVAPSPSLEMTAPTANTEKYQTNEPNPVHAVAKTPVSTFSIDVDTGSYTNVRRYLNNGRLPPVDAVRIEEMVNYFDYGYAAPKDGKPFAVHSTVFDSPWQQGAKVIRLGIKGKEMSTQALPPANLVFLVDVSGSMSSEEKLPLAKHTLRVLTEQLRDVDTITLITYASGEEVVLPPTKGTKENKDKILTAINKLEASGSTNGEQAIQTAYDQAEKAYIKDGINRILLLTDGDFNVGVTDFNTLKGMVAEKRKAGVSLSTFGFGQGNYNEKLMEQIADAGDGNYSYIDNKNEAKKVLHRQLSSTLATIAQDVKIQVEFNPATVKEYRLIGYENRMLKQEDFNNDKVDAGDIGAGHSVTALYEIIPVGQKGWLGESRYQEVPTAKGKTNEYANVAVRYKLPNQDKSILMSTPIANQSIAFAKADKDSQWAVAVASYAELLRGGKYAGSMDYKAVKALAEKQKGDDAYGLKGEFIELVGIADSLSSKKPQQ